MNDYSKEMAIILPTCDKYFDVVKEYMRYLRMNWDDCPFDIFVVSEEKVYEDPRVVGIKTTSTTSWTGRVLEALKYTQCPYILLSVEDAYFAKPVDNNDIYEVLDFIKNHNIKYYRNPKEGHKKTKENAFPDFEYACKIRKDTVYSRSLGIVIWERNTLIEMFGDGTKSAWDIENYFLQSSLTETKKAYFEDWVSDQRNFLNVIETVSGGKWMWKPIQDFKKLGIPVNVGNRPVSPKSDYYRRRLHVVANLIVPKKMRRPIKKFISKFGYKFGAEN